MAPHQIATGRADAGGNGGTPEPGAAACAPGCPPSAFKGMAVAAPLGLLAWAALIALLRRLLGDHLIGLGLAGFVVGIAVAARRDGFGRWPR